MEKNKCLRCDHEWLPRSPNKSVLCPKCRSNCWDKPKFRGFKNKCLRCEYEWYPRRSNRVKACPKCRSSYWDRPKTRYFKTSHKKESS